MNGISVVVQEIQRNREGVAILMNDVWHSTVIRFKYVALESYGLTSSFQGLKYVL